MSTTPTYSVSNPTPGQHYYAPAAYQVVPNGGSNVTCTVLSYDSSGNLQSVSNLEAIIRDVTDATDVFSYSAGGVKVTCTSSSNTNGSRVFAAGGSVGSSCARLDMYLTYTGHTADNPPNVPTDLTPQQNQIVTTLTPLFSGDFTDPDVGNTIGQYEIQVYNGASGSGSLKWDSGNVTASSSEIANAEFSRTYSGAALSYGSTYSWRARVADNLGLWSGWSSFLTFSVVQGPNAPASVTPTGLLAPSSSSSVAFGFTYTTPGAASMASYEYQIKTPAGVLVYDSGVVADSVANNGTVSGTIPGAAGLQYGQNYTFTVWCTDTNSAQSPSVTNNFGLAALPIATPTAPIGNATVNSHTPTLTWNYTDPNYAQAYAQVQVYNASTGALIEDTGIAANTAHQHIVGTSIAYGTLIRWRVAVQDSAALLGFFSPWAYAYVNNAPTAAWTNPTNLGTVVTATPTLTWSYTPSGGAYAQASALITLYDSTGTNQLSQWTVSGTGTSFNLPAGLLQNGVSYQLALQVTDTNAGVGNATTITFELLYTPPADMQGQPLASGKNFLTNAFLTTDANHDGIADGWSANNSGGGISPAYAIDANVVQPVQLASGDGPAMGAQKMTVQGGVTGSGQYINLHQTIHCSAAGWSPGSTRFSVEANVIVAGGLNAILSVNFVDQSNTYISTVAGSPQGDTAGATVTLLGPQNATIPANCEHIDVFLQLQSTASGQTGSAWWFDAQVESRGDWLASPALNTDGGSGVATGWTSSTHANVTAAYSIDTGINNPGSNGTGAQKIAVTADTAAVGLLAEVYQDVLLSGTTLIAGVDSVIASALIKVAAVVGSPVGQVTLEFRDGSNAVISDTASGTIAAGGSSFAVAAVAATLIPSNAAKIRVYLQGVSTIAGDTGNFWFMDAWMGKSASLASSSNFIEGSLGTGYSYDGNNFSVLTTLSGGQPSILANPGNDGDPSSAAGGSISISWDTTLADATRFVQYIVERRRQDQSDDDTQWVLLADITNKATGSLVDYSVGGSVTYQYSIRQQIQYADGSTGYSAHRAIVTGSVVFSPAWYLTNTQGTFYNFRLALVQTKRKTAWKEAAVYTQYLGRLGMARDAGPAQGYTLTLAAYFLDSNGDDRRAVKAAFLAVQQLNLVWSLKDPRGMVLPVYWGDMDFDEEDIGGDGLLTVTFNFQQAQDTNDY